MVVSVGTMALALLLMSLAPAHAMGVATPKGFPSATAPRTLLGDATSHTVSGPCGVLAACMNPTACPIMSEVPPPAFGVVIATTVGSFTIHVNTSWAPPYAQRLWVMARLDYMTGGPFFRVLNMNDGQETFVAQVCPPCVVCGVRGRARGSGSCVDAVWTHSQLNPCRCTPCDPVTSTAGATAAATTCSFFVCFL